MSFSTFLVVCMTVAALGGILILIALYMGRSRRDTTVRAITPRDLAGGVPEITEPVDAVPEMTEPIEDLTPEVVLDLDPDIQHPRPISHMPPPAVPATFGPRPFDDIDTQIRPRVARGTTNPPPIPVDAGRGARRRPTSAPPPVPGFARKQTERSSS